MRNNNNNNNNNKSDDDEKEYSIFDLVHAPEPPATSLNHLNSMNNRSFSASSPALFYSPQQRTPRNRPTTTRPRSMSLSKMTPKLRRTPSDENKYHTDRLGGGSSDSIQLDTSIHRRNSSGSLEFSNSQRHSGNSPTVGKRKLNKHVARSLLSQSVPAVNSMKLPQLVQEVRRDDVSSSTTKNQPGSFHSKQQKSQMTSTKLAPTSSIDSDSTQQNNNHASHDTNMNTKAQMNYSTNRKKLLSSEEELSLSGANNDIASSSVPKTDSSPSRQNRRQSHPPSYSPDNHQQHNNESEMKRSRQLWFQNVSMNRLETLDSDDIQQPNNNKRNINLTDSSSTSAIVQTSAISGTTNRATRFRHTFSGRIGTNMPDPIMKSTTQVSARVQQSLRHVQSSSNHLKRSTMASLVGRNSVRNAPSLDLLECDEEDITQNDDRTNPASPQNTSPVRAVFNQDLRSRTIVGELDLPKPQLQPSPKILSPYNNQSMNSHSNQSESFESSSDRCSISTLGYNQDSVSKIDGNAQLDVNRGNEDLSMEDYYSGSSMDFDDIFDNQTQRHGHETSTNDEDDNQSSTTDFHPEHSAITEENPDDLDYEEDCTIEIISQDGSLNDSPLAKIAKSQRVRRETKSRNSSSYPSTRNDRLHSNRGSFPRGLSSWGEDMNEINDNGQVDSENDHKNEDGEVIDSSQSTFEDAKDIHSSFFHGVSQRLQGNRTVRVNGTTATQKSTKMTIFGRFCYWKEISLCVVHRLPCFWCFDYPYTDKSILSRLNVLLAFFTMTQLASCLYLFIIMFSPSVADRNLNDTTDNDSLNSYFAGGGRMLLTSTWNQNGCILFLGFFAMMITVATIVNLSVIRNVNLVGAIRYLWFLFWLIPLETFFTIGLFDVFRTSHVWVKFSWRDATMAKFRQYFCENNTANTMCAVPVLADPTLETQWCLDHYNSTECVDIRARAQHKTKRFISYFYFCNGAWGLCVVVMLVLACKTLECIISKPLAQKSKESNISSWLLLPATSCLGVGCLYTFPFASAINIRSFSTKSEAAWIGPLYMVAGGLFLVASGLSWFMSSYSILSTRDKRTKSAATLIFISIMGSLMLLLTSVFIASIVFARYLQKNLLTGVRRGTVACVIDGGTVCSRCNELYDRCPEWADEDITTVIQSQAKSSAALAAICFVYTIVALQFGFTLRKHLSLYQIEYV